MQIYLPIAEISVNIFLLLALGGISGMLSGLFGVGGGFIMTPMLIFTGVPPAVAVATSANQIAASSLTGFLNHLRRGNVDFAMGNLLLAGGFVGSSLGVALFRMLKSSGDIDLVISLGYVVFLSLVGAMMMKDRIRTWLRGKRPPPALPRQQWHERLPWKKTFPRSGIEVSRLLPLGIGALVGIMVSFMGVGGGFFLIPAMVYWLRMPVTVVIGTSLYQIIFTTSYVTFLQALTTQTVDVVLAFFLLSSSVIGAQMGARLGAKLPAEHLRGGLAALLLIMALKLGYGLFVPPKELFSVVMK